MSQIFISYSREDLAFATNDLDTRIDWKSIPKDKGWYRGYWGIEERVI